MGSIRHRPRNPALPIVFDTAFDELRDAFYDRLDEERLQLLSLGAALAGSRSGNPRVIDHLALRAHRLQGRAEIFEIAAIAEAASRLEQAAIRALAPGVPNGDTSVQTALVALVQLISTFSAAGADGPSAGRAE